MRKAVLSAVGTERIEGWADELEIKLTELDRRKDAWAGTSVSVRIAILEEIKTHLLGVAEDWVKTACRKKGIPEGSPLEGEEWLGGPYALMSACNQFIRTLSQLNGKTFLKNIPLRDLPNGQIAARVLPHTKWDHLLLSGVKAEVWMQKGVTKSNLSQHTASSYDSPRVFRTGAISLILGAGNVAAIAPLDCFQKLFVEHQVVILKMNPVNDYLMEFLIPALRPLIEFGALRIVRGGTEVGSYLCNHRLVEEIHITGSEASHDAIVWGLGDEGKRNRANGTPKNRKRITSELGAVCPTIVVPGPWTAADIAFQAENIATQKLQNSGFNCVACQMLILPESWEKSDELVKAVETVMATAPGRPAYYPGAEKRMADFAGHAEASLDFERPNSPACVVVPFVQGQDDYLEKTEVFAPAMSVLRLAGNDAEAYLRSAIEYANEKLHGTLGANILIHPRTIKAIGRDRFDALIAELRYGGIAINAWSALGFLLVQTPWGAFPGHTPDDIQSGSGFVHNSFMFDKPERTVVEAPFRPHPRNLLSFDLSLLPRPPWFITNRKARVLGKLLTAFEYRPSFVKLPRIFLNALRG
ncbi:aldehyde dehydrogenase family protein [Phyllobacterium sp. OV277]|uniref:aldehyde dehydrogenase family protein n=1 Tax=Phyllobacterium sp. OV277 TaxID=1882772 RepID=UPI000883649E|nr:aldehyde dehydrogenase family protein [Phyllobacterium sp. OV277]SDP68437.1 aldehyde dehydrogenase (NAD(P)+) [Phyllobacterium sp. OV277]